jgi:hypothetical protein
VGEVRGWDDADVAGAEEIEGSWGGALQWSRGRRESGAMGIEGEAERAREMRETHREKGGGVRGEDWEGASVRIGAEREWE